MTKPTHRAYIAPDAPEGSERKARRIEIEAACPHKNGKGFDLVVPPGMSVARRIVCMPPREESGKE
jgi:hypothetical protein